MSQRTVARPQVRPEPLLQLWRIGLDPAEEGRVVHLHPTVLQHQLEIAVADREHQIPSDRPQDHLGRELPASELLALRHDPRAAIRLVGTARLPNPDPPHKLATDPPRSLTNPQLNANGCGPKGRFQAHHPAGPHSSEQGDLATVAQSTWHSHAGYGPWRSTRADLSRTNGEHGQSR